MIEGVALRWPECQHDSAFAERERKFVAYVVGLLNIAAHVLFPAPHKSEFKSPPTIHTSVSGTPLKSQILRLRAMLSKAWYKQKLPFKLGCALEPYSVKTGISIRAVGAPRQENFLSYLLLHPGIFSWTFHDITNFIRGLPESFMTFI